MPQYVYKCPDDHYAEHIHRMLYSTAIVCECGSEMWRVPQMPLITWGGLPPSQGGMGPAAKELLDPAEQDRLRAKYAEKKAARGETWP